MKKTIVFILCLLFVFSMFTGCNPASKETVEQKDNEKTNKTEKTEQVEEPEYMELDVLKIGVAKMPSQMDPSIGVGNTSIRINYNIFETLICADQKENFNLKPMLASEWKRIDDYTLEFSLKKGVKFHNGDELTSKDIEYSFNRLKEEITGIGLASSLMATIEKVEIVDEYTCRIVSSVVDPILEDRIASSWGSWIIPADYVTEVGYEEFGARPIGTGPFKVTSYSPEKVILERFDDYWGEKPNVKRIEYILYPETAARMTALITGEVDIITQLPPDQVPVIEKEENLRVTGQNITNMHMLIFNTEDGPLADKKLRQALRLSIDRQLLVDTLWSGKAVVPRGHQYPEFADMYFEDYPLAEYDLEKAKQLVEESSYNGEEIGYELANGYYTFGNEAAEAIVDMWKQIGVNAKVVFTDKKEYTHVANWSNTMRFPDPCGGLWLLWGPTSSRAKNTWINIDEEFLSTGEELSSIIDPEKRKELARNLMEIWDDVAPGTVLYYPFESWGVRKGLEWEPYPSQAMDFRADNFKVIKE